MTEQEALESAIEALGIECQRLSTEAYHWSTYTDDQSFNKEEGLNSAHIVERYNKAIIVLQAMVVRMRQAPTE